MNRRHGGLNQLNLENAAEYLDLSVNLNPYRSKRTVVLSAEELAHYPDPHSWKLRRILAKARAVDVSRIALGNGATELLWAAARAFLGVDDAALVMQPSFSEFTTAAAQCAAKVGVMKGDEEQDFQIDLDALHSRMERERPKVLSLCNPNSPSGTYLEVESIQNLASQHPGCLILLDESFLSLSPYHRQADALYPDNVLRIISLTKDHAIAGIRLGYALGSPMIIERLAAEIPSWSVNVLAQRIGEGLLDDPSFLERSRELIFRDKAWLEAELELRGIRYIPSSSIFILFKEDEAHFAGRLFEEHKILLRSCESYGLKGWYRVAVRPQREMERFLHGYDTIKRRV